MRRRICRVVSVLIVVCFLFTSVIYAAPISYRKAAAQDKLRLPLTMWKDAHKVGEAEVSPALPIRTELKVPEGQPKNFFTVDYHGYNLTNLLAKPLDQIPDKVVNAVREKIRQGVTQERILGAVVNDSGGTDIDILVTHNYGERNAAVQRLIIEAIKTGCLKAQELGLLRKDVDINSMSLTDLTKALRAKYKPHSITERGDEPVVVAKIIGAGIGAATELSLFNGYYA